MRKNTITRHHVWITYSNNFKPTITYQLETYSLDSKIHQSFNCIFSQTRIFSMRININFPIMVLFLILTRNTLFLWRLNAYRLYLQVITITDITNPAGTQIEWSVLNIIPTRTKQSNSCGPISTDSIKNHGHCGENH